MENTTIKHEERLKRYSENTIRIPLDELVDTQENVYELTSKAIKKAAVIASREDYVNAIEEQTKDENTHMIKKDSCKVCSVALSELLLKNKDTNTEKA